MTKHQAFSSAVPVEDVVPITPRIGAEIRGLHLTGDLSEGVFGDLSNLLLRYKVLFFRDQDHLDDSEQERFARRFGDLVPHPTQGALPDTAAVLELDSSGGGGRADQWHTDVTFVAAYPSISILRGVVIPQSGGDTIWANTATAYDHLPPALKSLADALWAVHSNAYDYAAVRPRATEQERAHYEEVFTSTIYETEHPVVRVHPETRERTVLLGNFAQRLVGLSKSDSQKIIEILQAYVTVPENTVRWRWTPNDVAIWDNRATQHYAVNDYGDARRVVRRVTIDGDVPAGIDGRRSVTRTRTSKAA